MGHAGADTQLAADLEDPVAAGLQLQDFRLYFGLNPTPAEFRSFRLGASETGVDSLSNDPPLRKSDQDKLDVTICALVGML